MFRHNAFSQVLLVWSLCIVHLTAEENKFCKLIKSEGGLKKVIDCKKKLNPEFLIKLDLECKKESDCESLSDEEFLTKMCVSLDEAWNEKLKKCYNDKFTAYIDKHDEALEKVIDLMECYWPEEKI